MLGSVFCDLATVEIDPPNDFEQQPNHAEAEDKPEQEHRDFGLRLSLRRTLVDSWLPLLEEEGHPTEPWVGLVVR